MRPEGLEPPRVAPPAPKAGASASSATVARRYNNSMPRAVLASLAIGLLTACVREPTYPPPPPPASAVGRVVVTPATDTLRPGDSTRLVAVVFDTAGRDLTGFPVTWVSDSPTVASVSPAGVVVGVSPGHSTVRASAGGASDEGVVTVGTPFVLDGVWDYRQIATDTLHRAGTCADTGSFVFTSVDSHFTGVSDKVSSCSIGFGTGALFGHMAGSTIYFGTTETQCNYTAILGKGTVDTINGSMWCDLSNVYRFVGTWTATRGAPVASVGIVPGTRRTVPAGATQLTPVLRDVTGARVFGRSVTWSSADPLVAT